MHIREGFGIDNVDYCSGAYSGGEWAGVAHSMALGGAAGWRAAGVKTPGLQFSHWIPTRHLKKVGPKAVRLGGKNGWYRMNGNYVTPKRHFKHDPYAYGTKKGEWRTWGPRYPAVIRQLDRIPRLFSGTAGGAAWGAGGRALNDI